MNNQGRMGEKEGDDALAYIAFPSIEDRSFRVSLGLERKRLISMWMMISSSQEN